MLTREKGAAPWALRASNSPKHGGRLVIGARMADLDDEVIMVSSGGVLIFEQLFQKSPNSEEMRPESR